MKKLLISLALLVVAAVALAQIDLGMKVGATFYLYESGNRVGQIYVPARAADARHYNEHWVLFLNYVYPGPKTLVTLDVVPAAVSPYQSEKDFFARVPFAPGSKYVKVTSDEFNEIPRVR
jgi:hypothetical protein